LNAIMIIEPNTKWSSRSHRAVRGDSVPGNNLHPIFWTDPPQAPSNCTRRDAAFSAAQDKTANKKDSETRDGSILERTRKK